MSEHPLSSYLHAQTLAQEAIRLCLQGVLYDAEELLLRVRTGLKRLSGDLPIVGFTGYSRSLEDSTDILFETRLFEEAQAWGWLEIASGVFKLVQHLPGTGMMHFTRAWRIWRLWSMDAARQEPIHYHEACRERARAGLWLGEAWARSMSDRAEHAANAVIRAALAELKRLEEPDLLQEIILQQQQLPPAPRGSPAYQPSGRTVPYVCSLL